MEYRKFLKKVISSILTWKAKKVLDKFKPVIIVVTGQKNRAIFKDEITDYLNEKDLDVASNKPGYNYRLGLPLFILGQNAGFGSPWKWLKVILAPSNRVKLAKYLVVEVASCEGKDSDILNNFLKP